MFNFNFSGKNFTKKKCEFVDAPVGTDDFVEINSIKIPCNFKRTTPSEKKVKAKIEYYHSTNHTLKDPITVIPLYGTNGKPNGYYSLRDNYIGYLILLFNGVNAIPIKYSTSFE